MGLLRTKKHHAQYLSYIRRGGLASGCRLCEKKPLKEFKYWRIVENRFPYDKIANVHHMLIPKRHVGETELSPRETKELLALKQGYISAHYEYLIEAVHKQKSIPAHFHLHLIVSKD
jgi:diadenosine tetraphosphate (Ap4A) HIT family hydrolase